MELAIVGLGRMGHNMALRLLRAGHRVVGVDAVLEKADRLATENGAIVADSLPAALRKLSAPRIMWLMLPAGAITEHAVEQFAAHAAPGDVLIDGGNSNYGDTQRRAARLAACGMTLLDCGTSGGIWGLQCGYCLMVGGERAAFDYCEPLFLALAAEGGYAHVGRSGAGHYAKMIHNGIEYGLMQAYGEGFEILQASEFDYDLHSLAELWNHGSVVRSWLLELAAHAFEQEKGSLEEIRGYVEDSGEGRWTVQEAIRLDVSAPVITLSLLSRIASRKDNAFSAKV
ncbi:MAG: phosphogluconate dehydrogenase (NAD(+)-dependent, decarboxylating), partial [Rudaea sp.]